MPYAPDLADRIDDLLPQTQCTRCGYPACRPYAEAIAIGAADINRCPPGGEATLATLARMLDRDPPALDHRARAARSAASRAHRRTCMHRLHAVHQRMPGRRDHRRAKTHARRARHAVQRLRPLRRAVPRRLHRHGAGRPRMDGGGCTRRACAVRGTRSPTRRGGATCHAQRRSTQARSLCRQRTRTCTCEKGRGVRGETAVVSQAWLSAPPRRRTARAAQPSIPR